VGSRKSPFQPIIAARISAKISAVRTLVIEPISNTFDLFHFATLKRKTAARDRPLLGRHLVAKHIRGGDPSRAF
jgi:hypothetical protein